MEHKSDKEQAEGAGGAQPGVKEAWRDLITLQLSE